MAYSNFRHCCSAVLAETEPLHASPRSPKKHGFLHVEGVVVRTTLRVTHSRPTDAVICVHSIAVWAGCARVAQRPILVPVLVKDHPKWPVHGNPPLACTRWRMGLWCKCWPWCSLEGSAGRRMELKTSNARQNEPESAKSLSSALERSKSPSDLVAGFKVVRGHHPTTLRQHGRALTRLISQTARR